MRLGSTSARSCLLALSAALVVTLLFVGTPSASAQMEGVISGQVMDIAGKPWADIGIQAVSEQGQKSETKTDSGGNFTIRGLRNGLYSLLVVLPAPNKPYEVKVRVNGADTPKVALNFKDIVAKQGGEAAEQVKKQEEERQKFQGLKARFEAGIGLLGQVDQKKKDLAKAPADQREALRSEIKDLSGKAVTEFEAAKSAAGEKDSNLPLIWAKLAESYDAAGRTDDAVNAYNQAIQLKPSPDYYNNLGGILGRAGKTEEAMAAYNKCAELNPAGAAQAYRNAGITLYNVGKMKEAVEPLKKATQLDPNSAQAWYLLGASLVGSMEYKKVGDKMEVVIQPGTVEAYQQAIQKDTSGDPNGYGAQAKLGLEALQQMAPGIDIKVKAGKKKS